MTGPAVLPASDRRRIAVVGGGVIGLSCAYELLGRGHRIDVYDPGDVRRSTSWAAAGMIAPAYELMLHDGQASDALTALCFDSAGQWPGFAARIQQDAGMPVGFNRKPTLALARNGPEAERLEALQAMLHAMDHPATPLGQTDVVARFGLSPEVRAAIELPTDHQVDNRRLLTALRRAITQRGGAFFKAEIQSRQDLPDTYDAVIWARGIRERGVSRRIKGQALALHPMPGGPGRVMRFGAFYIVPKPDRIVIGATSETEFTTDAVEPHRIRALLAEATAVLPSLRRATLRESWAGFRPLGDTLQPLIGALEPDEFIASAHYRNGVLLAPATARLIADHVEGLTLSGNANAFQPAQPMPATA